MPAPSLFDLHAGRHTIMPGDIYAYWGLSQPQAPLPEPPVEYQTPVYQWEPEELTQQWHPQSTPEYPGAGYFPPWEYTNLGQKPKLGGVRVLTDFTFLLMLSLCSSVFTLCHCIIHASLFSFSRFLFVCLSSLKRKPKNIFFFFFCLLGAFLCK